MWDTPSCQLEDLTKPASQLLSEVGSVLFVDQMGKGLGGDENITKGLQN